MPKSTKICKVCGREYEYCRTLRHTEGVFRWQDVACCAEHGSTYFARIQASRSGVPSGKNTSDDDTAMKEAVPDYSDLDECDGEDEWFGDDFEDDTEETAIDD
jgi:hypothetical protein